MEGVDNHIVACAELLEGSLERDVTVLIDTSGSTGREIQASYSSYSVDYIHCLQLLLVETMLLCQRSCCLCQDRKHLMETGSALM